MARKAARERGHSAAPRPGSVWRREAALFAAFFLGALALHAWLLRLPYFWDEAGYFIPAARDLLLTGTLIPQSTLNNIHPPLVSAWLALAWKIAGYKTIVARVAMLLVTAFALLGTYRLGRRCLNREVGIAAALLTAIFPVFFAQSALANLDLAAAAFTLWAVERHLSGRVFQSAVFSSLAVLSKETAILTPLAIFAWEAFCHLFRDHWPALERVAMPRRSWGTLLTMLLPVAPLAAWVGYHYARTGWLLGNPEFVRYNVEGTLTVARFFLALLQRLWQLFGHMGMAALTLAAVTAMFFPAAAGKDGSARPRIAVPFQFVLLAIVAAYLAALSAIGGAVLARYLLPVYPFVILLGVSTLRRRVREWVYLIVLIGGLFVGAWFWRPPYHFAPEDNLAYADFVRLHEEGTGVLARRYAHSSVLTAWPASDELTRPWLGYVARPLSVVRMEDFTLDSVTAAQHSTAPFDVIFAFSTKYEPANTVLPRWWEAAQRRYFDYHRDLPPEAIAAMFDGKIVWMERRSGLWVAVIEVPQNRQAALTNEQERGER